MMLAQEAMTSIAELAAFAQDLEESHQMRLRSTRMNYALDANVMWFFQRPLDRNERNFSGFTSKLVGSALAITIVRDMLEHLAGLGQLKIMESHRHEIERTYIELGIPNYRSMVEAVEQSIEACLQRRRLGNTSNLSAAREIVDLLKEESGEYFSLLTDIISDAPGRRAQIEAMTTTLRVVETDSVPPELARTLRKIQFLLREGDHRASLSVVQDIRALRDLALHNFRHESDRIAILTFDKRLLDAVRLVRHWNEPWSQYLLLENCQTFWLWDFTRDKKSKKNPASTLLGVMNDFRERAGRIFRMSNDPEETNNGERPVWLSDKRNLIVLYKVILGKHTENIAEKNENDLKIETANRIKNTVEAQRRVLDELSLDLDAVHLLKISCSEFFKEVGSMIPAIVLHAEIDKEEELARALERHGLSKEIFLRELDTEIQRHAKQSLKILGATSLLAPRTIKAVNQYLELTSNRPVVGHFIPRLPVPIESDAFNFQELVRLVSTTTDRAETRFDNLIQFGALRGAVADLVIAYVLTHSGEWREALEILSEAERRYTEQSDDASIYYEICVLLAAILRMYEVAGKAMSRAEELLRSALSSKSERPKADRHDLRVRLELLSLKLNRTILENYSGVNIDRATQDMAYEELTSLLSAFRDLKGEISRISAGHAVAEKLIANVNVNIVLLREIFLHDGPAKSSDEFYVAILKEGANRIIDRSIKVSYFEEVVMGYAVISNIRYLSGIGVPDRAFMLSIRSKVGLILQRRERITPFEYKVYLAINRGLAGLGYPK